MRSHLTTRIADEGHTLGQELTCLVRQGKGITGRSHLTDHCPMLIALKRQELAYVREGFKTFILIRSQQRDHRVSLRLKVSEERCCHTLTVHHYTSR